MHQSTYIERMIDLSDPDANIFLNMSDEEAAEAVASGDVQRVGQIDGQFALVQKRGKLVRMARSIGRPLRYFLAKQAAGPCLVVAERIDELKTFLDQEGLGDQFHPSYTRMVPAHYLLELGLLGCPDPNPTYHRFFDPARNHLSPDLDEIGAAYIGVLADECNRWLNQIDEKQPLGVLFSGGIDSGSIFLVLHHLLLQRGESPSRLKAFTLSIGENSLDASQAAHFLNELDMSLYLEPVEVSAADVDFRDAVRVIEDYKPLDVQSATMALAICRGIRQRYPD